MNLLVFFFISLQCSHHTLTLLIAKELQLHSDVTLVRTQLDVGEDQGAWKLVLVGPNGLYRWELLFLPEGLKQKRELSVIVFFCLGGGGYVCEGI